MTNNPTAQTWQYQQQAEQQAENYQKGLLSSAQTALSGLGKDPALRWKGITGPPSIKPYNPRTTLRETVSGKPAGGGFGNSGGGKAQ